MALNSKPEIIAEVELLLCLRINRWFKYAMTEVIFSLRARPTLRIYKLVQLAEYSPEVSRRGR